VTPAPIPLVRASGSHHDVGLALGRATAPIVRRAVAACPQGARARAEPFREVTAQELPWLVEEWDGVAEGAGVDPLALFAVSVEQLWDEPPSHGTGARGRCSDLAARAPATVDGHVWVAHNNDLSAGAEADLVAAEREVPGEPLVFSIGVGPWISVGWNAAGLSLTGNELSPNDERVGIPPLLGIHDVLRRRSLEDAVEASLHPRRSSSYNNLLAHRDGGVVSVEGSATDASLIAPDARGRLAHTNHYVSETMRRYEGDPSYATRSAVRYESACAWLAEGPVSEELLRAALCDHAHAPDSLCRHPGPGSDTKTVFWCLADVTRGTISYGRGNPCDSQVQRYAFA
jgi:isopenicillin-N N-acyltransferase-like protein